MDRYLTILEVSQKQAYIFGSNKVADNIVNSAVIAKCLSPEYIKRILVQGYDERNNLVYSGGGHTILEFDDCVIAKKCVATLTERIYRDFDGLCVYAKTIPYIEELSPKENLKNLTAELETKKAVRRSEFYHGTFGIEKLDINTHKPISCEETDEKAIVRKEENSVSTKKFTPEGYNPTYKFEDLGTEKNKSSFIAVVHIDGNGMGKRVDELYDCMDSSYWNTVKMTLRRFSDEIDSDFKTAYMEITNEVAMSISGGDLKGRLNIKTEDGKPLFPVRRIITAGDDICFVTEGRIGLECARIFIEKLSTKKNSVDSKGYSACAGVSIVHQKYPFYKAYKLSESLCSSAKKFGAVISAADNGRNVCSIDWHIEFGEIKDSVDLIRKDYISDDGINLTSKPYVITADNNILEKIKPEKKYSSFRGQMRKIINNEKEIGSGKIKQLRVVMKKGCAETTNYTKFYRIKDNFSFDAIEMMDTFLMI